MKNKKSTIILFCCCAMLSCEMIFAQQKVISADKQYAFIRKLKSEGRAMNIDADFAQMLTGKKAVTAAKKAGLADTTYDDTGKKILSIDVANDYFIANQNKKIRSLPLSFKVKYEAENIGIKSQAALKKRFESGYADRLYILTIKADSVVVIHEVYLP